MKPIARLALALPVLVGAFLFARWPGPSRPSPTPRPEVERGAARLIAELDRRIAFHEQRARAQHQDWLDLEQAASAWLERARLSGRWEDYLRAEETLARAFDLAEPGAGPFLTRARLSFTLHRFGAVEADLERAERTLLLPPEEARAIAELRADLAFHAGRYAEARSAFEALLSKERTPTRLARLAQWHWKTGGFEAAEPLLEEASRRLSEAGGEGLAWIELQRGLMSLDRGRLEEALAAYRRADAALPGWYLVEEHLAEVLTRQGQLADARRIYEDVVARTGSPELMAALAEVLDGLGEAQAAAEWRRRAGDGWERWLVALPEAAYGHALEFFMEHGPPARAVELAERNRAVRPSGESEALLAAAYLRAGRQAEAKRAVEAALATPYSSAALFATAALIFAAAGDEARASAERARATAIDPRAFDELAGLEERAARATLEDAGSEL